MLLNTLISTCLLAASAPRVIAAQDMPSSGDVSIDSTAIGNINIVNSDRGCPKGSVGTTLAADNSFLTLIFDRLSAEIGGGAPASNRRVICNVDVKINAPSEWQYCVETADYRGYTKLDDGVNGTIKASYNFGRGEEGRIQKDVIGPMTADFLLHQDGEVAKKVWSACGTPTSTFRMNLSVALASRKKEGSGVIVTDSADAKFTQKLSLGWRKCADQVAQSSLQSRPTQASQGSQPSQASPPTVGYTDYGRPLSAEQAAQGVGK